MWFVLLLLCLTVNMQFAFSVSTTTTTTRTGTPLTPQQQQQHTYINCQNENNKNCQVKRRVEKSRAGFVDDDATDVIHIIEPPQHFQQLKMIINQMEMGNERKIGTNSIIYQKPKTIATTTLKNIKEIPKRNNNKRNNRNNENLKVRVNNSIIVAGTTTTTTTAATTSITTTSKMPTMTMKTTIKPIIGKLLQQRKTKVRQHVVRPTGYERINQQQQQQHKQQRRNTVSYKQLQQMKEPINFKIPNVRMHGKSSSSRNISSSSSFDTISNSSKSNVNNLDLLTEETNIVAHKIPSTVGLPLEILASLRKTERILYEKKIHKKQLLPISTATTTASAAQRHKTKRTHTVIMQQGYEHEYNKHGQEHQLAAEKINYNYYNNDNNDNNNYKSRNKRSIVEKSLTNLTQAMYIVKHINELLKNATKYLPNDNDDDYYNKNHHIDNAIEQTTKALIKNNLKKVANKLSAEFVENTQPKVLIGEIAEYAKDGENIGIYEFLENSVNVTELLLERQPTYKRPQNHCKRNVNLHEVPMKLGQRVRNLQYKVLCMQQQQEKAQQQQQQRDKRKSKYNHLNVRQAATTSTSSIQLPVRLSRQLSTFDDSKTLQKVKVLKPKNYNNDIHTHELLYDDVMSNIRNMLQARATSNESSRQTTSSTTTTTTTTRIPRDVNIETKSNSTIANIVTNGKLHFNNFKDLSEYINHLGEVVGNLPYNFNNKSNDNKINKKTNYNKNREKLDENSENLLWFRITNDGHIVQQHIDEAIDSLPSHTSIFHTFPDIPDAEDLNLPLGISQQQKSAKINH